jgi:hypothetical protein
MKGGKACATYSGKPTLRAKTRLALQEGAGGDDLGVSQDVAGEHNLLNIIDDEIQRYKTERSSRTQ